PPPLVPDIARPAAPSDHVPGAVAAGAARALRARAALRPLGQLEAQIATHRVGLGEAEFQALAERVAFAALLADQAEARLVMAEIFVAQDRGRDQPVAAQRLDRGEEAEWLHAGDPAIEHLPDMIGEIGGDIAVHRLAFGD